MSGYYIRNVGAYGDLALWWRPESRGYTSLIDEAGVYTKAEAESIVRNRPEQDVAYAKADVDALVRPVAFRDSLCDLVPIVGAR